MVKKDNRKQFLKDFLYTCEKFPNYEFWGHIMDCDISAKALSDKITCQISLVSKRLLNYDIDLLEKDNDIENYHPYFIELIATMSVEEYKNIKHKYNDTNTEEVQWVELSLFKTPCKKYKEGKFAYEGHYIYGASLLRRQYVYFVIGETKDLKKQDEEALKQLATAYDTMKTKIADPLHEKEILTSFYNKIINTHKIKGIIHNVGQANCVELYFETAKDNVCVMFDVGTSMFEGTGGKGSYIRENWKALREVKPQYIVLSHWDIDHIAGIGEIDDDKHTVYDDIKWIAPNIFQLTFSKISISAFRLCAYLLYKGNISLIQSNICINNALNYPFKHKGIIVRMFTGNGEQGNSTKNNNIGLCMELLYSHKENGKMQGVLMPGDCEYSKIRKMIHQECEYGFLIASHHGSNNSQDCNDIHASNNGVAVICTGINTYGHPGRSHFQNLITSGFEIHTVYGWHGISFEIEKGKSEVLVDFITSYTYEKT